MHRLTNMCSKSSALSGLNRPLRLIPGDLLSACPHRQFHTLPGLLDSRAALPNPYPNALRAMQGGSLYHFYDGLWYDPAGRRTHDLPCERPQRYKGRLKYDSVSTWLKVLHLYASLRIRIRSVLHNILSIPFMALCNLFFFMNMSTSYTSEKHYSAVF